MPDARYIRVMIDNNEMDLPEEQLPLAISYELEDEDNFQVKKSSTALSVAFPATTHNDAIANAFSNPGSDDNTQDELFTRFRQAIIEASGSELLVGKAFLVKATHSDRPLSYEYDFFGNNADWKIDLEELTLHDVFKHLVIEFSKTKMMESWAFDGTSEAMPYVFAPVRYRDAMSEDDTNMEAIYMRPSLSIYWALYWGFKLAGYKLQSSFFDTNYFRRLVMPWTWGNFLYSDGTRLTDIDFLAKSSDAFFRNFTQTGFIDAKVSNDSTSGAFDNNGVYSYNAGTFEMRWEYLSAFNYGKLDATFYLNAFVEATVTANSDTDLKVYWYKNGVQQRITDMVDLEAPLVGRKDFFGPAEVWETFEVNPGDVITAKLWLRTFKSGLGRCNVKVSVDAFEIAYFRIPLGGTIDFENFTSLKKYKWLDLLRGVIDLFNLQPGTDSVNRTIRLEPLHPYSLTANLSIKQPGYFNENILDWSDRQDLSKISTIEQVSNAEREMQFTLRADSNDGGFNILKDRNQNKPASGKYVFPDRFKAGTKEVENRFFSPMMHFEADQWKYITGVSPQLPCIIPENISNTSRDEAQNTFLPKIAWYKGNITGVGGWKFDGTEYASLPYMFAVNYKAGGEQDPVLSYSDERIGPEGSPVIGAGLMRRFYLQRLAITRHGKKYTTFFHLNNRDIGNWLHREHIVCRGQRWELVAINNYRPLQEETTEVVLRRWVPIEEQDATRCYPSQSSVEENVFADDFDEKYSALKVLASDIPK